MTPEEKMAELGLELKPVAIGSAALIPWVQVGSDYSIAEGKEAAREVAWSQLCAAKSALGELSRIKRVVKVLGMVNSAPGFADQPQVVNGFSELLVEVFGENGRHARSAVGMAGLPGNVPVEVEVIFEIE